MRQKKSCYSLFFAAAMCLAMIGVSRMFLKMESRSFYLHMATVLTVCCGITSCIRTGGIIKKQEFIMVVIGMLCCTAIFMKVIYYEVFAAGALMAIACFLILFSLIVYQYRISVPFVALLNSVGALALIIGIFTKSTNMWGAVQIGYINPQTIGSWALIFSVIALLTFDDIVECRKHKFFLGLSQILLYGMMFYITLLTESRFSSGLMILQLLIRLLPKFRILNVKSFRALAAVSPILVFLLSRILYDLGFFTDEMGGSLMNGRENIWKTWFGEAVLHPFIGIGFNEIDANSFYSHNIFIDYCTMFGLVAALCFFAAMTYIVIRKVPYFTMGRSKAESRSRLVYDSFVSFLIILLASSCEGCFFSVGAGGLYIFSFVPLILAASPNCDHIETAYTR